MTSGEDCDDPSHHNQRGFEPRGVKSCLRQQAHTAQVWGKWSGRRGFGGQHARWACDAIARGMPMGLEVGIRTSVAKNLVLVLDHDKILVSRSAPTSRDLRQMQADKSGLREKESFLPYTGADVQWLGYGQPLPPKKQTFLRAVHVVRAADGTCVCKRGVGSWARSRGRGAPGLLDARRPNRFGRPVLARQARPGRRSPPRAPILPSSEGAYATHHRNKTNFCGGEWV